MSQGRWCDNSYLCICVQPRPQCVSDERSISVQFVFSVLNFDNQYVFTCTLKPVNMSTAQGKKKIAHTTDVSTCILVTLMVWDSDS